MIYQFDLQGNLIKIHKSILDTQINKVLNKKLPQAYGYYWSYKRKFLYKPDNRYIPIASYKDNGEFIKSFTSLKDAANFYGLRNIHNIESCIQGYHKHCAGVRWRYFYGNTSSIKSL